MGKIITEKDFWQCTGGAIPTQFQSGQDVAKKKTGEKYIIKLDKATVGWIDFGCTKLMLLYAVMAAIAAVIAALIVGTGGAALIAVAAIAGAAGAAYGAAVGGLICGQMVAPIRWWKPLTKNNFQIFKQDTITGKNQMQCDAFTFLGMAPQTIFFNDKIKTWSQAIAKGAASYIGGILEGMLAGACIGSGVAAGQALLAAGGWAAAGNTMVQFGKQMPMNFIKNIGASWGYAGGFSKSAAGFMMGLRSLMGIQGGLDNYADTGEVNGGTAAAAGWGFIGMEVGLIESPYKIITDFTNGTSNATWHDYMGILLSFAPVHSNFDESKGKSGNLDDANKKSDLDGAPEKNDPDGNPKGNGPEDGGNPKKGKDGDAFEYNKEVKENRYGMRLLTQDQFIAFEARMKKLGVKVEIDFKGELKREGLAAGFDRETGTVILRPDATYIETFHEGIHAQQWHDIGKENYIAKGELSRERHVYNNLIKNKHLFTESEIYMAQRQLYVYETGSPPTSPYWEGYPMDKVFDENP